jgi:hypothetical protein
MDYFNSTVGTKHDMLISNVSDKNEHLNEIKAFMSKLKNKEDELLKA